MTPIRNIIFDWGRTLYDPDAERLFDGVLELLPEFRKNRRLFIVALATKGEAQIAKRRAILRDSGIESFFDDVLFATENKEALYDELFRKHSLDPKETAIVDDRMIRGIAWGNHHGTMTVWVKNGKFAQEVPNETTGFPTHTITAFSELKEIFF